MFFSFQQKAFSFLRRFKELLRILPFDTSTQEGRSKERYRRIALTSVSNAGAKGVAILVNLLSLPLSLNYLGKELFGLWMTITSLVFWLYLSDFGLLNGITNALAEAHGKDDVAKGRGIISSALVAICVTTFALIGVLLLSFSYIPWGAILKIADPTLSSLAQMSFFIAGGMFLASLPFEVVKRACLAYQMGFIQAIVQAVTSILSFLGILLAVFFQLNMLWMVFLVASGPFIANCSLLFFFPRIAPWYSFHWKEVSLSHLKRISESSFPLFIYQLCNLGMHQSVNVVIARAAGLSVVADFSVISRIYYSLAALGGGFSDPFYPAIREAFEKKEKAWILRSIFRVVAIRIAVLLPPSLMLLFLGDWIISLWIHQTLTFDLLGWCSFLLSLLCFSINTTLSDVLNSLDEIASQIKLLSFSAIIALLGIYFLVPLLGISAVFLSFAVSTLYPMYWSWKKLQKEIIHKLA